MLRKAAPALASADIDLVHVAVAHLRQFIVARRGEIEETGKIVR
jgi:hypothetical protein